MAYVAPFASLLFGGSERVEQSASVAYGSPPALDCGARIRTRWTCWPRRTLAGAVCSAASCVPLDLAPHSKSPNGPVVETVRPNLTIDTDPHLQEAASPQMVVVRSFLRYAPRQLFLKRKCR